MKPIRSRPEKNNKNRKYGKNNGAPRSIPSLSPSLSALIPLLLAFPHGLQAQPALLPQASDIDWVSWENLSEAQRAAIDDNCCGAYIEPPLPESGEAAGSTLIRGALLEGEADGLTEANEGIEVIGEDGHIVADSGSYRQQDGILTLRDNVRLRRPGLLMTGTSARVDRDEARSELQQASYLLHDSAIRGSAEVIVYTDSNGVITIDNGVFTRCEPGDDSWLIGGEEIRLNRNTGRGMARDVKLRVRDVPVLYLPWISFPINDERSSGFLAPVMGSTRDGGFDFALPYYFNLAPNYDMTLTPRIQTERGVMLGIEGRYLGRRHEQQLTLELLPGDKLYDPATLNQPGTDSPPAEDRWLLDYDYRGRLAKGWSAQLDYSSVSDIDYFQDLGNNGLITTSQSYMRRRGRLKYKGENWDFNAMALGFQLIDPTVSSRFEPYRVLPGMELNGYYYHDSGLEYGLDTEFARFDRNLNPADFSQAQIDDGILVTGSRLALTPKLSFPLSNSYSFLTPTVKYKYATWDLRDQGPDNPDSPDRGILTGTLDSGLIFERELELFGESRLQTLEPRLFYLYSEYEDQSDIPLFDSSELTFSWSQLFRDDRFSGQDRVGDADQLTLALSSRLYDEAGQELARASIGQIRHFRDRRVTLRNPPGLDEREDSSALVGELSLNLGGNWRAGSYLEWDTGADELAVGNFQFQFQSDINHILNFGYRYRQVPGPAVANGIKRRIDQSDISGVWPLSSSWALIGRWNYDLANDRNLETLAGLEYSNCCWALRVVGRQWIDNDALFHGIEDDNSGVFIQFELKGLGSVLGGNVTGILSNGISGYRERNYVQ